MACVPQFDKSVDRSNSVRILGNKGFGKNNLHSSLQLYSEALLLAPYKSKEYFLALGNRSAVLLKLEHYQACLNDVERVLDWSEAPTRLREKIEGRKSEAMNYCDSLKEGCSFPVDHSLPELLNGKHESILSLSSAVKMCYNPDQGRHLKVTCDVNAGCVLIVERPYAAVLLSHCSQSHCYHCFRILPLDWIPCSKCNVLFCNEFCMESADQKYHKFECGQVEKLENIGIGHLALRILLNTPPQQLINSISWLSTEGTYGMNGESFDMNPFHAVMSLESHHEQTLVEDLIKYRDVANGLIKLLMMKGYCNEKCWEKCQKNGKEIVRGILVGIIEKLICNAHAITGFITSNDTVANNAVSESRCQLKIATAIYPVTCLTNHSCCPNVFSSFINGSTVILRATENLPKGTEILNCYGPKFGSMPREARLPALSQQYFFDCGCVACSSGEYLRIEQEMTAFKCKNCDGPSIMVNKRDVNCLDCKSSHTLETSENNFICVLENDIKECLENGQVKIEKINLLELNLYQHNRRLIELRDLCSRALTENGSLEDAELLIERNVKSLIRWYGENSIEVGEELIKLADIEAGLCHLDKLKHIVIKAKNIFKIHYGTNHPYYLELKERFEASARNTNGAKKLTGQLKNRTSKGRTERFNSFICLTL